MAKEILSKEIAKKLLKIKGETRGLNLQTDARLIREKEGEEGLEKFEAELGKAGFPIKHSEIETLKFYPLSLRAASLLAMKKVFGWGDEEYRELGRRALTEPPFIRMYMIFFHSIEAMVKQTPRLWDEYFSTGQMTVPDYSEEEKYAILHMKDFDLLPAHCRIMEGYIEGIAKMIVKPKKIRCRETKCTFKGDTYHEFKVTWE